MGFSRTELTGAVTLNHVKHRDRRQVFAVACGVGLDSTGMLVLLSDLGIRPDVITFADVGDYENDKAGREARVVLGVRWLCGGMTKRGRAQLEDHRQAGDGLGAGDAAGVGG